jgi:hypothetical protein
MPDASYEEGHLFLRENLPFERFCEVVKGLEYIQRNLNWFLGDAVLYARRTYGQRGYRAFQGFLRMGFGTQRLESCAWVSDRIPPERRRIGVTWSNHRKVAKLQEGEQERALDAIAGIPADHYAIQFRLMVLGSALRYDVWVPHADLSRAKHFQTNEHLSVRTSLPQLDPGNDAAQEIVSRIDVIWLEHGRGYAAAFEVERTTAVHSGILRLSDLASVAPNVALDMFIVAPAERGPRVISELNRPTFRKEPLALHKRCRLIFFEDLISKIDAVGDLVAAMNGPGFLNIVATSCDRPTAELPDDSDE